MASDQEGELGHIFTVVTVAETRLLLGLDSFAAFNII